MCGIAGIFMPKEAAAVLRVKVLEMSRRIRHRGPDSSGIHSSSRVHLVHERLAIMDLEQGQQPIYSPDGAVVLIVNGEIYNFRELKAEVEDYPFTSTSDSEILMALYLKYGVSFLDRLNGMFGLAIFDGRDDSFLIARDHLGIIPLYYGSDDLGQVFVGSELKCLEGFCKQIAQFPPGHYLYSKMSLHPERYYHRHWSTVPGTSKDITEIRSALEAAVERQLVADVPYAVLLSGGLDSSVIAAIVKRILDRRQEGTTASPVVLDSFAIGLKGSPDLEAARKAAEFIGTRHHEIHFTIQEGLDALRDVIYHLETYDVTTVRAATPMFLLARAIRARGFKMVLSGEGSDELFGGYLYFHKAPNARAFHEETVRKLSKLYQYDCLRANKALCAWGVEGRVPFLDKEFVDTAMEFDPEQKMIKDGRMEKWALRQAFAGYLPDTILWRQKEQFSDGVGYSWIDSLKAMVEKEVSDVNFNYAAVNFPVQPPRTKEEYYYRSIFESYYASSAAVLTVPSAKSVACSTSEALVWDTSFEMMDEPSGRSISDIHLEAYTTI
ncbi:asparagine synthase B [Sphingobacterium paucimobilis]|uniref:asparagine synthase (glutamine-hydrolyzing) n=1 Tax=Sphingobacterium paucimobilis HER1398 TaxID=1346330 RepID=U2J8N6_9SPHI|nr:asparagine synthase B [Sphingobacterium paucimobilis]ERJ59023.1 hypothetical protein M472_09595 [Sphingobacterium paucimobilis HER1398]